MIIQCCMETNLIYNKGVPGSLPNVNVKINKYYIISRKEAFVKKSA